MKGVLLWFVRWTRHSCSRAGPPVSECVRYLLYLLCMATVPNRVKIFYDFSPTLFVELDREGDAEGVLNGLNPAAHHVPDHSDLVAQRILNPRQRRHLSLGRRRVVKGVGQLASGHASGGHMKAVLVKLIALSRGPVYHRGDVVGSALAAAVVGHVQTEDLQLGVVGEENIAARRHRHACDVNNSVAHSLVAAQAVAGVDDVYGAGAVNAQQAELFGGQLFRQDERPVGGEVQADQRAEL